MLVVGSLREAPLLEAIELRRLDRGKSAAPRVLRRRRGAHHESACEHPRRAHPPLRRDVAVDSPFHDSDLPSSEYMTYLVNNPNISLRAAPVTAGSPGMSRTLRFEKEGRAWRLRRRSAWGLAVMGRNLARNLARHGFTVAVHNRTPTRTRELRACATTSALTATSATTATGLFTPAGPNE